LGSVAVYKCLVMDPDIDLARPSSDETPFTSEKKPRVSVSARYVDLVRFADVKLANQVHQEHFLVDREAAAALVAGLATVFGPSTCPPEAPCP
jgi:hypothetical protein